MIPLKYHWTITSIWAGFFVCLFCCLFPFGVFCFVFVGRWRGWGRWLAMPGSMQDLSSSTRDRTCAPCTESVVFTTALPGKSLGWVLCIAQRDWTKYLGCICSSTWKGQSFIFLSRSSFQKPPCGNCSLIGHFPRGKHFCVPENMFKNSASATLTLQIYLMCGLWYGKIQKPGAVDLDFSPDLTGY